MALALPLLLGLALSPLLGGSLSTLTRLHVRAIPLLYLALALQLAAFPVSGGLWHMPDRIAVAFWLASYACLMVAAIKNISLAGIPVIGAGIAANLAAILANGGHMPVLPRALEAAGLHYRVHYNSALDGAPHLAILVDRFAAPGWIPLANVYSIGDILISIGAFTFALSATRALDVRLPRRTPRAN